MSSHVTTHYRRFMHLLASPHTGGQLSEKDGALVARPRLFKGRLYTYPIVNGIPILVRQAEAMHLNPPESGKISQNIEEYIVPPQFKKAKLILHLGSGNVLCRDKRVISLDILPCENVDIVGEAEALPFATNSFDVVESGAVFEHVYDPLAAIREVRRVLKPGGVFRIDNSFLQPYHGFPSHYFAMTPQANETYLIDDFILEESSIPDSGTPLMTLAMMLERFMLNLDRRQKEELMQLPLEKFLELVRSDVTSRSPLMKDFSEFEKRSMAATHVVIAKKPADYEKKLAQKHKNAGSLDAWQRLKREYYTRRCEIMLRHHEVFAYKRFALDLDARVRFKDITFPPPVQKILRPLRLKDPFDVAELKRMLEAMRTQEEMLVRTRDQVIGVYLACKDRAEQAAAAKSEG